jgi:hypothetical protein
MQFILYGLFAGNERVADLAMKPFEISGEQRGIGFVLDVARSSEAAIVRQADLFAEAHRYFQWHGLLLRWSDVVSLKIPDV